MVINVIYTPGTALQSLGLNIKTPAWDIINCSRCREPLGFSHVDAREQIETVVIIKPAQQEVIGENIRCLCEKCQVPVH